MVDLVITDGTIVDGEKARFAADIAVDNGRIVEISPGLRAKFPSARVIDAEGRYIVPGLIDAHVHLGGSAGTASSFEEFTPEQFELNLRAYLYNGVTAVLDMGAMKDLILEWRQMEREGELLAPRIFAVGPGFTAPGGHPVSTIFKGLPSEIVDQMACQVAEPRAAEEGVAELAEEGVDAIKAIYDDAKGAIPKLSYAVLEAIAAEAHRHGLKIFVHVGTVRDAIDAIEAGADGIEHMIDEPDPKLTELLELAAQKGVLYTPTLAVYEASSSIATDPSFLKHYDTAGSVSRRVLEGLQAEGFLARYRRKREELRRGLEAAVENTGKAYRMGVKLALGTDAGNPATFHGLAVHRELKLLVEAGLSPREALIAATKTAAEKLGAPELVAVEAGKAADLLILEAGADPLENIANLRRIEWVIKRGVPYRREELAIDPERRRDGTQEA